MALSADTNAELLAAPAGDADVAALKAAYEKHGHALFRRCRQLLGNDDDAYELVQEVFCQFWRGREKFEGRSALFTYLYRIATNLSIDRLRRRKTRRQEATFTFDDDRDGSDDRLPSRRLEALKQVVDLTDGLDENTVTTAVLVYVDELTQEEAAEVLQVSRRTIGKRLKKFMKHTRERANIGA